ncbi:MAG TPA: DUF1003 domain-containing protein [Candidatus Saccharimonadales bacterium]|nr:DUF1003 domain-containing protein [Candidatus Saccharimonadales bacterium]
MYTPRNWHRAHKDSLTWGERAADRLRNGMGSWKFVFSFLIFMGAWALINTLAAWRHWDEYPFILLNLFLSMLAGLQGAILLIAAKRADSISAAMAQHDYETNTDAKKEVEDLMAINKKQLALIEELLAAAKDKK